MLHLLPKAQDVPKMLHIFKSMDEEFHWTPESAWRTLNRFYTTPGSAIAFRSAYKIYKHFDGVLPLKKIKEFLHSQIVFTLHTVKPKRARSFAPIKVYARRELLECDLVEVSSISKFNDNVNQLLVVVDAFSKALWCQPLLDKKVSTVLSAFKKIHNEMKRNNDPKVFAICTDKGNV